MPLRSCAAASARPGVVMAADEGFDPWFTDHDHRFHAANLTDERADFDAADLLGHLALPSTARVIDAGCGDGRMAVRLAALGMDVVAVDADPSQIDRCRDVASRRGVKLELIAERLENLELEAPADGAFLWFNTFGTLDDEGNAGVLLALRRSLVAGAPLLIDTHRRAAVIAALDGAEAVVEEVGGWTQVDELTFDHASDRLVIHRRVASGDQVLVNRTIRHWLPDPSMWPAILEAAHFELVELLERGDDGLLVRAIAR